MPRPVRALGATFGTPFTASLPSGAGSRGRRAASPASPTSPGSGAALPAAAVTGASIAGSTLLASSSASKLPSAGQACVTPEDKVWVRVLGPDGEEHRFRVERDINTTNLRKAVKTKVGVPLRELDLRVGGQVLMEGVARPLEGLRGDALLVRWERRNRIESLLEYRHLADVNDRGKFDRTLLHFAVLDGDPDICKEIVDRKDLQQGVINFQDVFRDTPLMLASILGYTEIVETLIDRQAALDHQNLCGRTAVQMAAEHGHRDVVKALLQEGAEEGIGVPVMGPMGRYVVSKRASYLAELNERHAVMQRIRLHRLSKRSDIFDLPPAEKASQASKSVPAAEATAEVAPETPQEKQ